MRVWIYYSLIHSLIISSRMSFSAEAYGLDAREIGVQRSGTPEEAVDEMKPMLILDFHQQFLELGDLKTTERTLEREMISSGANSIQSFVYIFDSVKKMREARTRVFEALPHVFWSPDDEIAQDLKIQKKPTISTTVLTSFNEEGDGALSMMCYDFFKITSKNPSARDDMGLNAEEVGEELNLDPKTVEWLKNEIPNPDHQILVLNYELAFFNRGNFEADKQKVATALIELGAIRINDRVFKFENSGEMHAAKYKIQNNLKWCIYSPNFETAEHFNISDQPTITTTVISCDPDKNDKWWIVPWGLFDF